MSTPTLADIWQLRQRVPGDIAEADLARALAALEDASAWIRAEAGTEDWLDDAGLLEAVPGAIVSVCCAVARRILDNPEGLLQESVVGYSYGRTNATTDIYLTKAEKALIRKLVGGNGMVVVTLESPYLPPPVAPYLGYDAYSDWYTAQ